MKQERQRRKTENRGAESGQDEDKRKTEQELKKKPFVESGSRQTP